MPASHGQVPVYEVRIELKAASHGGYRLIGIAAAQCLGGRQGFRVTAHGMGQFLVRQGVGVVKLHRLFRKIDGPQQRRLRFFLCRGEMMPVNGQGLRPQSISLGSAKAFGEVSRLEEPAIEAGTQHLVDGLGHHGAGTQYGNRQ